MADEISGFLHPRSTAPRNDSYLGPSSYHRCHQNKKLHKTKKILVLQQLQQQLSLSLSFSVSHLLLSTSSREIQQVIFYVLSLGGYWQLISTCLRRLWKESHSTDFFSYLSGHPSICVFLLLLLLLLFLERRRPYIHIHIHIPTSSKQTKNKSSALCEGCRNDNEKCTNSFHFYLALLSVGMVPV